MEQITYKEGYKYQLTRNYNIKTSILGHSINTAYINLTTNGRLYIKKGYAWDGPSGPTIDTLSFMRGSLVHDALYQLMRENLLDKDVYRDTADILLKDICATDGMVKGFTWVVYKLVKLLASSAADPSNKKPNIKAPR